MPEKAENFWQDAAYLSAQILLSLIAFTIVISLLVFLVRKPMRKYKPTDLAIFDRLKSFTSPGRTRLMLFITFLGKHQFLIPANLLLIFYFLFVSRHSWFSVRVAAIAISSLVLMIFLKQLFRRRRPLAPLLTAVRGLSFPSGHAIMAVTFWGLIIYIILQLNNNSIGSFLLVFLFVVLILLIGFSRVYLRVHYASDVLAGFIIGLLWLLISLVVVKRVEGFISSEKEVGSLQLAVRSRHSFSDELPPAISPSDTRWRRNFQTRITLQTLWCRLRTANCELFHAPSSNWFLTSSKYFPLLWDSSSCVPSSMIDPFSMTTILSAFITVLKR